MSHRLRAFVILFGLISGLPPMAHAQERAASNAMDTQMTWQALSLHAISLNSRITTTNDVIEKSENCGNIGKVYAPATAGADAAGCLIPGLPASVLITINNAKNTLHTKIENANFILNCGSDGKIYDKSSNTCTTVVRMDMVAKTVQSASSQKGGGKFASYALATCPADSVMIGCSGARNASITDTCDESDCGLVGYGPVNASTCRATVDTDKGTNPTIWATCLKNK